MISTTCGGLARGNVDIREMTVTALIQPYVYLSRTLNHETDRSIRKSLSALQLMGRWCFCQDFIRAVISRLLKEKGREQFWPKKCNLRRTRKNMKN
jgi:hypothetical protein